MAQLGLVVVVVGLGTDLDLLDLHHALALFGFLLLFLLLVLELAVVHDAADRRFGGGSDFHQVHTGFLGKGNSLVALQNTQLFPIGADDAHFAGADHLVAAHAVLRHVAPGSHVRRSYSASLHS